MLCPYYLLCTPSLQAVDMTSETRASAESSVAGAAQDENETSAAFGVLT